MSDNTADRRRFTRINFDSKAVISQDDQNWAGTLTDVSLKGVMLETEQPLPLAQDSEVQLTILLLGNEITIEAPATLAHQHDNFYGFSLHDLDLDAMTQIRRLVELNLGDEALLERELEQMIHLTTS